LKGKILRVLKGRKNSTMSWIFETATIKSLDQIPEGTFGFIYKVTDTATGRMYIGKKQLMSYRTLPPLKGEKKKRKVVKESDWKTYYGSHPDLKKAVKENPEHFKREVLQFVTTKKQLTYYELVYLIKEDVLGNELYYNDNILGKFFRRDLV
jgi:serine/threonine protein kinase